MTIDTTAVASSSPRRIILSTTPSDSHTWNLVFLELLLGELGFQVHNLGPCVPVEHLVQVASRDEPDALLISSVNGHGYIDGRRIARAIRAEQSTHTLPLFIGGKLDIRPLRQLQVQDLLDSGYNGVFSDEIDTARLKSSIIEVTNGRSKPSLSTSRS